MKRTNMGTKEISFEEKIGEIAAAIHQAGMDPYAQLSGFLRTGNDAYITRLNNARQKIKCLDRAKIQQYVEAELDRRKRQSG